jgi:hypothetical protein
MAKETTKTTETTDNENSINLADVKAQVEAMLEAAKAEAAKIIADAKASVSGELTEEEKKAKAAEEAYWNELVEVKLFKDNNKYKDDVYVSVNGKRYNVPRGVEVEVPAGVAEILETSMAQDEATERFVRRQVVDWDEKAKEL